MSARFEIVPFNEQQLLTVQDSDGAVRVVIKPICEGMGLAWHGQFERIKRHPVLSEGIRVTRIPSSGGMQDAVTLDLECFHGWLMTITPDRIKDEAARDLVISYQKKAFRVVFEHFHGPMRIVETKPATISDFLRLGNALKKERNRAIRNGLWQLMDQLCDSLGINRLSHEGIGWAEPDHSELHTLFWNGVRAVEDAGHIINHSRRNHLVALNLPELRHHFHEIGVPVEIDTTMTQALRLSRNPAYLADKTYNCRDDKRRHCWIFSHAPLLEAMEGA
ncbi:MAG: phage antirepressor N-terminal domain-containing protein [Sphingobium sp.]